MGVIRVVGVVGVRVIGVVVLVVVIVIGVVDDTLVGGTVKYLLQFGYIPKVLSGHTLAV